MTGNTEITKPANAVYFPALDGFRAIAFLLVFLQHYFMLHYGWSGVNAFFVLSGFLITGILIDTKDDAHRTWNFYLRRSLRIFPLYYALVVAVLVTWGLLRWSLTWQWVLWPVYLGNFLRYIPHAASQDAAWDAAWKGFLVSPVLQVAVNFGHLWSLAVEEQFYLFWPFVVFSLSRRSLRAVCIATVLFIPLLRFWVSATAPIWLLKAEVLYRLLPFQIDSMLLGALIAILWRSDLRESMLHIAQKIALPVVLLCGIGFAVSSYYGKGIPLAELQTNWPFTGGLVLINLAAATVMIAILAPGTILYSALNASWLRWIGRVSYGAYIFHDLVRGIVSRQVYRPHIRAYFPTPLMQQILIALIAFILTLLLAGLSFSLFESKFLKLKNRWTRRSA